MLSNKNFSPDKPYNDLPLLPPNQDVETRKILKRCIEARAALAELKQAGELIPNQAMLINTIPVLEAQASSEIENIVTTADRLFQYAQMSETNPSSDPATKEALRYGQALFEGYQTIQERPLVTATAIRVCSKIKAVEMTIRRVPGTALVAQGSNRIIYTPPEGEEVLWQKLKNWEEFIHQATEIDPLIRLAIMHYQFEAIHPFSDGNGRTGRILNLLFLLDQGLLDIPVLYLSRYIIKNKDDYYRNLQNVTLNSAWEDWICFTLEAVQETSLWTTGKIKAIRQLMDLTAEYFKAKSPKIYRWELVELIFTQPYCRIGNVVNAGIAKRQAASVYLKTLVEIGVLKEWSSGRDKLFIHPRFLNLLLAEEHGVTPYE